MVVRGKGRLSGQQGSGQGLGRGSGQGGAPGSRAKGKNLGRAGLLAVQFRGSCSEPVSAQGHCGCGPTIGR